MTTNLECDRQSALTTLMERRLAYDEQVACALLDENDDERDERLQLVAAAEEMIRHAVYFSAQHATHEE